MRDLLTKDIGWKIFSIVLAAIIWWTVHSVSDQSLPEPVQFGDWESRVYTNLEVLVLSSAANVRDFRVEPESVSVKLAGRPENLKGMDDRDIHVAVDVTGIESARGLLRKRLNVSVPSGVIVLSVTPPEVGIIFPQSNETK